MPGTEVAFLLPAVSHEHHHEPEHHDEGSGFTSGVLLALLILIVVVAILLLFNFGPSVFNFNVRITSWQAPLSSLYEALL